MSMEVIDQMDQSAASVTAFVKQLRGLNITQLAEPEKAEYLEIVGQYENILDRLLMYICDEKPKFEYLQEVVTHKDPEIYEKLCNDIDTKTPTHIYDDIIKLQRLVKDRKQRIGSKRRDQLLRLVVMGGAGIALVIASIMTALITLASAGATTPLIVPIITTGFAIFSGFGGFRILFDLIQNGTEHAKLTLIDKNLATLENHLSDVRDKCDELRQANTKFGIDLKYKNFRIAEHDHDKIVAGSFVKDNSSARHQCHMCHLMIICKRLTKMEELIRYGA
ncbi:hypothetical protein EC968_007690 [Mortierella alpina]|nr:hypothetical protein EC968_007690 [Mortierella alpina]